MLGAGGAARAIAYTLARESDELVVLNRTVKTAQELAKLWKRHLTKKLLQAPFAKGNPENLARLRHSDQCDFSRDETES